MTFVDTKAIIQQAYRNGYAVPAINVDNTDTVTGLVRVCSEMRSPVIIQIAPIQVYSRDMDYKTIIDSIKALCDKYDVTASLHLDHGDSLEDLCVAVNSGFNSVMYDGSKLPFVKNLHQTIMARRYAQSISLEGELGIVGGAEGSSGNDNIKFSGYTNVKEAVTYVEKTNVDFLAVAIGNAHGTYRHLPQLNFTRLAELHESLDIPLVMHGASGIPEDDIKKAISLGVAKINFFTDIDKAFVKGVFASIEKNPSSYTFQCLVDARSAMELEVRRVIKMCGSAGKM